MPTSVNHHIGLRVADIDRSVRFYEEAFGARLRVQPMAYGPPDAGEIMEGPADLTFRVCHLGFDEGVIELFELNEPFRHTEKIPATRGGIIHFAIEVDDVEATLERVERAGGNRLWKDIRAISDTHRVIYVTDPDGNIIEIIDIGIDDLVDVCNAAAAGAPPGLS